MMPADVVQFIIDNPTFCMENLGRALDESQPFTKENQQSLLNGMLTKDVAEGVAQLKQNLQAEQSIPATQYQTLLEQSLTGAISELKGTSRWQTVRISTITEVAEQLAVIGRQRLLEQRMREELMEGRMTKFDALIAKAGDWLNFFVAIEPDRKDHAEALKWSAYVDFLTDEMNTTAPIPTAKPTPPTLTPSDTGTFADLFYHPEDLTLFTTVLRKVRFENPLLNDKGEWIGGKRDGSKSILVAGIERLEACVKIRKIGNRKLLVTLLNAHFPGLDMGDEARIFGEVVDQQLKLTFIALIPE